ncbi:MAG TPA: hypothetical protein VMX17_15565 [Candidatus Glassbacteria bacterium]|nr:hypothetical protein [Candidatus Glassbacteria bacterium]
MKIAAKKISQMGRDELVNLAVKDSGKIESVLQQAYKKNYVDVIVSISAFQGLTYDNIRTILTCLSSIKTFTNEDKINVLDNLLSYPKNIIEPFIANLNGMISNTEIAAFMLIKGGTPLDIIYKIMDVYNLLDPSHSFFINKRPKTSYESESETMYEKNSRLLKAVEVFLEEGYMWENKDSGIILTSRLTKKPDDSFISSIAKYNLHPLIFMALNESLKSIPSTGNSALQKNLAENKSKGAQLASSLQSVVSVPELLGLVKENPHMVHSVWDIIEEKINKSEVNIYDLFDTKYNGENIIDFLMQKSKHIAPRIIETLKRVQLPNAVSLGQPLKRFVSFCINDPSLRTKILELPVKFFDKILMNINDREVVDRFYGIKPEKDDSNDLIDLENLLSNTNWYKKYSLLEGELYVEAGMKERITTILTAIVLVFSGLGIKEVSKRLNVDEDQIEEALKNPIMVEEATQMLRSNQPMPVKNVSMDEFVNAIIQHEGLLPGQTPFRYTNQTMRRWDTIHGFPIDKVSPRPSNRNNFIFLKNKEDVPKAVRKQFENYINFPQRYGWQRQPSIQQSISKFDQTGASGKMSFLKKKFPSIDFSQPLSTIL